MFSYHYISQHVNRIFHLQKTQYVNFSCVSFSRFKQLNSSCWLEVLGKDQKLWSSFSFCCICLVPSSLSFHLLEIYEFSIWWNALAYRFCSSTGTKELVVLFTVKWQISSLCKAVKTYKNNTAYMILINVFISWMCLFMLEAWIELPEILNTEIF